MPDVQFLLRGLSIVMIDLILAGDNAVVIAMAVRALPPRERRMGILYGSGLAVIIRVALTLVAARLLTLPFLQLAGGLTVIWIAFQVLAEAEEAPDAATAPHQFLRAVWYIAGADLAMSIDNILAIAGASRGSFGLIVFGLCVSIPFVVVSSNLLAKLMDRYPAIVYLGVAILCKVAGDMVLEDRFVAQNLQPSNMVRYLVDGALILVVLVAGARARLARREAAAKSEI
jgi:YjbE family integral membrane protein